MGNNQAALHKRERTNDGSQRTRALSGTLNSHLPPSVSTDDGCPVQMRIAKDDFDPSADLLESNEYPVVFKWSTQNHPARVVHLAGSWDQWKSKIPLVKSTNDFSTIINLNPGSYEYKFLVDGKWMIDSQVNKTEKSGDVCNAMHIDEADFEDMEASNAGVAMKKMNSTGVQQPSHDTPNDREIEKLREFTQQLPDRRDFEKAPNPPVLPPHLLQVILNKDTPVSCDPNVLPEPNHVKRSENDAVLSVQVAPEDDDGYEVLVSYSIQVDEKEYFVDFDLWKKEQITFAVELGTCTSHSIKFQLEVHEILVPKSFNAPGPHRNFRILTSRGEVFVNTTWLKEQMGGSLFQDWYSRETQGESTVVPTSLSEDELEELLRACCSYSRVIVTRKSLQVLLDVGWRFKINAVLRATENYLLAAKGLHVMEKLDLAYRFKFAVLATTILKALSTKEQRIDTLTQYLDQRNIPFPPQHLLEMLDLS